MHRKEKSLPDKDDGLEATPRASSLDFIRAIIQEDNKTQKHNGRVITRFPPEPNGYLHIGHAKAVCLNFGIALENEKGVCHLRLDDTNPLKEERKYVDAILEDVRWLGFDWGQNLFYASDYFEPLYQFAVELIKKGKAYVCSLTPDEIRAYRGTLTEPGKESPYRNRPVKENLDLFQRMKDGEFEEGEHVLRAKIDMASPNMNMRDPAIYRIKKVSHPRTKDQWCIYPMYDFAHSLSDSIEKITHSICTLEFENHRPLYDWFLNELEREDHPQQIEFARLNLTYMIMSKRKLLRLVEGGMVSGWDDPRMPTLAGLRRRGYTPEAIKAFCQKIGVSKVDGVVDIALLEHCLRDDLNQRAARVMAVLRPIKIIIDNYPEDKIEELEAVNNPEDPEAGTRKIPFSKELFIEQSDFMEDPPKKFYRLSPGREVRLRYAYFIRCESVVKDEATGQIKEIHCTYDPASKGGKSPDGRKVKATLHWVCAKEALTAEVRLYDRLFKTENPDKGEEGKDFISNLNEDSLKVVPDARIEPTLAHAEPGGIYQFERLGYFCVDPQSSHNALVFNRTVPLRDKWAKIAKKK
jgi:glutaminyl-tRNA synthetase